jgi:integrase
VSKITPKEVAVFIKTAIESRGEQMTKKIRSRLRDVFRSAIEHGMIEVGKNPVEDVLNPKPAVKRMRMSLDDYRAILAEARKNPVDCWVANAMELALISGQRREDIVSMGFDQSKDGFLWVEQTKGEDGKRAKLRIPLELRLGAVGVSLDEVLKRCRDNVLSKSAIHFVHHKGTAKPGDAPKVSTLSKAFARLRDRAGITVEPGRTPTTFHELRSLAARLYAEQHGKEFAQALLGHKSAEMTALYRDSRGLEWTEIKLKAS